MIDGHEFLFSYGGEILSGIIKIDKSNTNKASVSLNSLPRIVIVNVDTLAKTSSFGFIESDHGYECSTSHYAATSLAQTAGLFQASEVVSENLLDALMQAASDSQYAFEKSIDEFELVYPEVDVSYNKNAFVYTNLTDLDKSYLDFVVETMTTSKTPLRLANSHVCDLHFADTLKIKLSLSSASESQLYFAF